MVDFIIKKSQEFKENGFIVIENFISLAEINIIKNKVEGLKNHIKVDIYNDRNGNLRRMENFVKKDKLFVDLNEKIKNLLLSITLKEQALFKDKVNFKPPKGEGFYPHYDGIFQFTKSDGVTRNGWYEYAEDFNNVLLPLDDFTTQNGALEIAKKRNGNFASLLDDTKRDGTPDIKESLVNELEFFPIYCTKGSVLIFKHNCPHQSKVNKSPLDRISLYLTYTNLEDGDFYERYFNDKHSSLNPYKALKGQQE